MIHIVNGNLYRLQTSGNLYLFAEVDTVTELYHFVAQTEAKGYSVLSVHQIKADGSTQEVDILSTVEYKKVKSQYLPFWKGASDE